MGVSLGYATTAAVTPAVRKAIQADARRLNKHRAWWCENLVFYKDPKRPTHLTGDTKLFVSLDAFADDDDPAGEVAADDDQFMAFHDARFILLSLAEWSRAHGVSWEVEMAGEPVATIADGRIDPPGLFQADATADRLRADDETAKRTAAKYAGR